MSFLSGSGSLRCPKCGELVGFKVAVDTVQVNTPRPRPDRHQSVLPLDGNLVINFLPAYPKHSCPEN